MEAPKTLRVEDKVVAPVAERVVNAPEDAVVPPIFTPSIVPPVATSVPAVIELEVEERVNVFPVLAPLEVTVSRVEVSEKVNVPEEEAMVVSVPALRVVVPTMPLIKEEGGTVTERMGLLGLVLSTVKDPAP